MSAALLPRPTSLRSLTSLFKPSTNDTYALGYFKNTNINADYLISKRFREWNRFLGKDIKTTEKFHELYPTLLARLSTGIFVKESRLTWIFEQKLRFDYTLASFDANAPQTI